MRHLPHDRCRLLRLAGAAADHDRSRVHTQAHLKRYLILRSGVLVGLMQTALQGEPGEHRTPGVILQGHRDTKQHQKAVVAHGLESAMIRLDLVFDQVEQRLAQAWQRLKTQALDQGDRIRQVPHSTVTSLRSAMRAPWRMGCTSAAGCRTCRAA